MLADSSTRNGFAGFPPLRRVNAPRRAGIEHGNAHVGGISSSRSRRLWYEYRSSPSRRPFSSACPSSRRALPCGRRPPAAWPRTPAGSARRSPDEVPHLGLLQQERVRRIDAAQFREDRGEPLGVRRRVPQQRTGRRRRSWRRPQGRKRRTSACGEAGAGSAQMRSSAGHVIHVAFIAPPHLIRSMLDCLTVMRSGSASGGPAAADAATPLAASMIGAVSNGADPARNRTAPTAERHRARTRNPAAPAPPSTTAQPVHRHAQVPRDDTSAVDGDNHAPALARGAVSRCG